MDYKKLAADLLSGCEENCANCEYAGDSEFECTIAQLAATAITDLLARAEAAEARVRELETSFRTEKCENGPECAELGRVRKALAEAEARAEKAEKCITEIEEALKFQRYSAAMLWVSEYREQKEE